MVTALAIIMALYIAFDIFVDRRLERRIDTLEEAVAVLLLDLDMLDISETDIED